MQITKKILQITVILAILAYLFKGIKFNQLYIALKQYSAMGIILTFLIGFLSYLALSLRWGYLMGDFSNIGPAFETVVIADFLNIILPARIGDLSKVFYLKRYYNYNTHNTFSVLFIERFLDINVLLLFTIFISLFYTENKKLKIGLVILFSFIILTILFIKSNIFLKLLKIIPFEKIKLYIEKVINGINEKLTLESLWIAVLYTSFLWITYFLKNIIFFKYTAHFSMNIFQLFILFAVSTVSFVVPITPGGMGTYQASVVFVATFYGISKEDALAAGIVLQALQIMVTALSFLFVLVKKGISFGSLRKLGK